MSTEIVRKLVEDARTKRKVQITKELVGEDKLSQVALEVASELRKLGEDVKLLAKDENTIEIRVEEKVFDLINA
ncbi:MAG: hypothetical protein J7L47_00865 [Candidatus Odinarchaeota archaeon]|nr:hypothetical protein [Candidatus Odinarchaeota archaeon]